MKLRNTAEMSEGKISIYELPLDMAHMLRGLSNRKEIFGQIFASDPLKELVKKLEKEGHTGSLEVLTNKGTGMILQVRGRFSTAYFETEGGVTFEKKEALNKIYELLDRDDTSARVFQSDFSPDIWKSRQGAGKGRASRLQELLEQRRPRPAQPPEDKDRRGRGRARRGGASSERTSTGRRSRSRFSPRSATRLRRCSPRSSSTWRRRRSAPRSSRRRTRPPTGSRRQAPRLREVPREPRRHAQATTTSRSSR